MYAGTIAVIIAGLIGLLAMMFGVEGDEPMGADIVPVVIPPMPTYAPDFSEDVEWELFHADAFEEYADAFDDYFHAIEYKRAKNGASMVRRPGGKSFRFVKKGK